MGGMYETGNAAFHNGDSVVLCLKQPFLGCLVLLKPFGSFFNCLYLLTTTQGQQHLSIYSVYVAYPVEMIARLHQMRDTHFSKQPV